MVASLCGCRLDPGQLKPASPVAGTLRVMKSAISKRPVWFVVVAIILLLWAVAGVGSFMAHVVVGEKMAAEKGAWDMEYYRALPAWFAWDYGLATLTALAGAIALLMRSRQAMMLYVLSLVGVVIQFGWALAHSIQFGCAFVGTDLLAHKGAAATVPFPMFIALMAGVQIVLARFAAKRGWVE